MDHRVLWPRTNAGGSSNAPTTGAQLPKPKARASAETEVDRAPADRSPQAPRGRRKLPIHWQGDGGASCNSGEAGGVGARAARGLARARVAKRRKAPLRWRLSRGSI